MFCHHYCLDFRLRQQPCNSHILGGNPGRSSERTEMPKSNKCVLVLWANGFEEATASIFITELRRAGIRVKIVSRTSHQIRGAHGLALVADLTLSQALPLLAEVTHLVIPATRHAMQPLKNDPYLSEFFDQITHHRIPILTCCKDKHSCHIIFSEAENISRFPVDNMYLTKFLQDFIRLAGNEDDNDI